MAQLERLVVKLEAENKDLKTGLKQSEKQMSNFGKSVGKIGGLIAGAFAADAIIEFGKEAFKLAERARGIEKAFGGLNNSNKLIKDLTQATGGAISQMRLMQMAVQAVNLGIDQNQLAKFFEFATIRAAETGESVDYLVNSIVTGVGRGSIMILDNLGISASQLGEGFASAGNKAEIVAGVIDEQLGNSKLTIEDAAATTDRLSAAFDNLQLSVGKLLLGEGEGVVSWLIDLTVAADNLVQAFDSAKMSQIMAAFATAATGNLKSAFDMLMGVKDANDRVAENTQKYFDVLSGNAWVQKDNVENLKKQEKATVELTEAQKKLAKAQASVGPGRSLAGVGTSADIAGKALLGDIEGSSKSVHAVLLDTNFELEKMGENMKKIGQSSLTTQQQLELFRQKTGMVAISAQELNMAVNDLAVGMAVSLGEALGDAMSGVGNFGANLLGAVGSFMQKLGAMMIATAIKVAIFKKALIASPAAALAAGIALVAIGKAFSNKAAAMSSSMGGGGGGGGLGGGGAASSRGVVGLSNQDRSMSGVQVNVVGRITPRGIEFVQEQNQRNRRFKG